MTMLEGADWSWLVRELACPVCKGPIAPQPEPPLVPQEILCLACGDVYGVYPASGVLDLRPQCPVVGTLQASIARTDYARRWQSVEKTPPPVSYRHPIPQRTSAGFLSYIQGTLSTGSFLVDLGCGNAPYRGPLKHMGLRYVATDFCRSAADLLVDAHVLPFRDACADAVLMHSVTQALENPFIAIAEVARVLRPGGLLLGTADLGAVFASDFFHLTPYGVLSLLGSQELEVTRMWVDKDILQFAASNPGYPAMLKPVLRVLSLVARWPVLSPRNWLTGRPADSFVTAGCFSFIARRVQG